MTRQAKITLMLAITAMVVPFLGLAFCSMQKSASAKRRLGFSVSKRKGGSAVRNSRTALGAQSSCSELAKSSAPTSPARDVPKLVRGVRDTGRLSW